MRLLRFILIFLGTTVLILGSIYLFNRESFHTVYHNRAALAEGSEWVEKTYSLGGLVSYMSEQPQHSAIAMFSSRSIINDHTDIHFESDRMIPSGTLSSIFLILTYADLVTTGQLDPDAAIDPGRIRIFYLPDWDQRYINRFNRWVQDHNHSPTVDQLIHYYVESRDHAIAGFLYFYLGEENVNKHVAELGKGYIEPPVPVYGIRMLALHDISTETQQLIRHLKYLAEKDRVAILGEATTIARNKWRNTSSGEPLKIPRITSFQAERMLHGLYPALQPDSFLKLLVGIWEDEIINPETSRLTQKILQSSSDDRLLDRHITAYASHFDERMGYMSGWSVARLQEDHRLQAQVIIFHDLPAGLWFHMNSNFMTRDFHHRLFYDPDIQLRSYRMLMDQH